MGDLLPRMKHERTSDLGIGGSESEKEVWNLICHLPSKLG